VVAGPHIALADTFLEDRGLVQDLGDKLVDNTEFVELVGYMVVVVADTPVVLFLLEGDNSGTPEERQEEVPPTADFEAAVAGIVGNPDSIVGYLTFLSLI